MSDLVFRISVGVVNLAVVLFVIDTYRALRDLRALSRVHQLTLHRLHERLRNVESSEVQDFQDEGRP